MIDEAYSAFSLSASEVHCNNQSWLPVAMSPRQRVGAIKGPVDRTRYKTRTGISLDRGFTRLV